MTARNYTKENSDEIFSNRERYAYVVLFIMDMDQTIGTRVAHIVEMKINGKKVAEDKIYMILYGGRYDFEVSYVWRETTSETQGDKTKITWSQSNLVRERKTFNLISGKDNVIFFDSKKGMYHETQGNFDWISTIWVSEVY